MKKDRGKVWLGVCAIVENTQGEWLVVKKSYSGLKGRWSLPAGFVQEGETINEAVVREVKEETKQTKFKSLVKPLVKNIEEIIQKEDI